MPPKQNRTTAQKRPRRGTKLIDSEAEESDYDEFDFSSPDYDSPSDYSDSEFDEVSEGPSEEDEEEE